MYLRRHTNYNFNLKKNPFNFTVKVIMRHARGKSKINFSVNWRQNEGRKEKQHSCHVPPNHIEPTFFSFPFQRSHDRLIILTCYFATMMHIFEN